MTTSPGAVAHRTPHQRGVAIAMTVVVLGATVAAVVMPPEAVMAVFAALILGAMLVQAHRDTALTIVVLLALMALIPASLALPELGSMGAPTTLVALAAGGLWLVTWVSPRSNVVTEVEGYRPIPILLAVWAASTTASYAVAALRAKDGLEASAADRGMVVMLASLGIALLIAETVPTRERLDSIIRVAVLAGTFIAAIGIIQFFIGWDYAAHVSIPGLKPTGSGLSITERSIFRRVAGTTLHPIEFGVVLCLIIPLGLHLAMHHSRRWFAPVAVMGLALPMSVSRTSFVGAAAAGLVLLSLWPRQTRRRALAVGFGYLVAVRLLVPGLLGTIRSLFTNATKDPSITSREQDYEFVGRFITENPLFGRGFFTFIPERYDYLDNQYMMTLVETGVIGLLALLTMIVGSMVVAHKVRARTDDPVDRDLAATFMAMLAVALSTAIAFDYLSFPSVRIMLFVAIGGVGALWRLVPDRSATQPGPSAAPEPATGTAVA